MAILESLDLSLLDILHIKVSQHTLFHPNNLLHNDYGVYESVGSNLIDCDNSIPAQPLQNPDLGQ